MYLCCSDTPSLEANSGLASVILFPIHLCKVLLSSNNLSTACDSRISRLTDCLESCKKESALTLQRATISSSREQPGFGALPRLGVQRAPRPQQQEEPVERQHWLHWTRQVRQHRQNKRGVKHHFRVQTPAQSTCCLAIRPQALPKTRNCRGRRTRRRGGRIVSRAPPQPHRNTKCRH